MGNLCSIYHAHFDKLLSLTDNNKNKAAVLDKFIFWWQISKYTLEDNKIWFTRPIEEIAKECSVSPRTINRFIKSFREENLIETHCTKYYKKHLYIRITDKVLTTLGQNNTINNVPVVENQPKAHKQPSEPVNSCQVDVIEKDNLALPIYKEKELQCIVNNSTVINDSIVDKQNPKFKTYAIEAHMGELLSNREKNYIKGVINQIKESDSTLISNPNQLFAEIVFSVTNEHQFKGISNFNHKLQIISKLIRTRRWMIPKGFYNHSDFGRFFKAPIAEAPGVAPISLSSINKSSTPQGRIKELKSALTEVISERNFNESYLREMYEREQGGHFVSQAVLDSIQSKITKSTEIAREYAQALDALMASDGKGASIQPIQSNWAQYDALCIQQRVVEQELDRATAVYEKALNGGLNPAATQKSTDDYLYFIEQYELINEELFQMGELLNQKKSA
ncbi:hypothetical protein TUM19329_37200 (plasmid) [Legionella antarctica]|uniref:Uncharacterized protein n=1 Tax=Legionella antarctica TaxID=2708020 RepID=A0A6F8TA58_9GAMM|nr:helix-turn-helix domain-containing protein [Legionella antarctica]BCA97359.1 hypothetical protein TUM19329_37200 [Legionella antarctica]